MVQKKSIIFVLLSIYIYIYLLMLKVSALKTIGRSYRFRGGGGGGGGNPEKFVCKSKKSPTNFFAGMFSQTTIQKKIVCLEKIFIPLLPKK